MSYHTHDRPALPAPLLDDDGDIVPLGRPTQTAVLADRAHDPASTAPGRHRRRGMLPAAVAAILVFAITAVIALSFGDSPARPPKIDDTGLTATLRQTSGAAQAVLQTAAQKRRATERRRELRARHRKVARRHAVRNRRAARRRDTARLARPRAPVAPPAAAAPRRPAPAATARQEEFPF
jgi:hypothetical protein